MRVLLSTIGSRVGLAGSYRLPFVPVGPSVRSRTGGSVAAMVAGQFATLREAAQDCAVIVGCNQLQVAAPSVAELLGIRYVFADYSPVALPSPHHAPPPMQGVASVPWEQEIERRNALWQGPLNEQRVAAGLAPIADVHGHIVTDRPLLAADQALAPWPPDSGLEVVQTGAWILPDRRPLPSKVKEFLSYGRHVRGRGTSLADDVERGGPAPTWFQDNHLGSRSCERSSTGCTPRSTDTSRARTASSTGRS